MSESTKLQLPRREQLRTAPGRLAKLEVPVKPATAVRDTSKIASSIRVLKSSAGFTKNPDDAKTDNVDSKSSSQDDDDTDHKSVIPELKKINNGGVNYCPGFTDLVCQCNNLETLPTTLRPRTSLEKRNCISNERLNELRKKAQEAIKTHKVFTIRGCFYTIRKALLQRGWVEKLDVHRRASMPCNLTLDEMLHQLPVRRPGESRRQYLIKCERNIISRFLEYTPVDFLWTARKEKADWIDMARNPSLIINKFHKVPFTTKEGLCSCLREFHWFYEDGLSETYYPRCFNVWNPDEMTDFIDDFRLTGCIGILKWLTETYTTKGMQGIASDSGTVPLTCIQFAIKRCREFVDFCHHYDIDSDENLKIWEHDWDVFLTHHFMLTHEDARIREDSNNSINCFLSLAEKILRDLEPFWPHLKTDGYLNIWIIKPGNRCRGRGIILMNNIKKIQNMVNPTTITKTRYVVQKYMERPLTIHNTKFDIRQWFLITSVQPLVIWMYKESYLRFSSQEYNLLNYHESVHLTNHAIQKKYVNGSRDERLPQENMWDCHTFQTYLRQIGQLDMWSERIYPGMQKAIIGSMLASQDSMDRRANTFELFGADFMISDDFYPWLIEINSSPDLGSTTSVTARLCPQCLEDTVKVIIDRKIDSKADTGGFEMIYKQCIPPAPAYMGLNLFLKGQQLMPKNGNIKRDKYKEESFTRLTRTTYVPRTPSNPVPPPINQNIPPTTQGPFIMDLIDCLNVKPNLKSINENTKKMTQSLMLKKVQNSLNRRNQQNNPRNISTAINRGNRKVSDVGERISMKSESHRRHASCGPKLVIHQIAEDNVTAMPQLENLQNPNKAKKEFTCIGNKYCSDKSLANAITDDNHNLPLTSSSSPATSRKPSHENIYKSKSASNILSKLQNRTNPAATNGGNGGKLLTGNNPKASKQFNKLTNEKDENYCSHFFAVGLSLRAWRAKYNKILKVQKENIKTPLVANSCSPTVKNKKLTGTTIGTSTSTAPVTPQILNSNS